jgi:DNA-binding transcriptional regulator YiaG
VAYSELDLKTHAYYEVGEYASEQLHANLPAWIVAHAELESRRVKDYYLWNPGRLSEKRAKVREYMKTYRKTDKVQQATRDRQRTEKYKAQAAATVRKRRDQNPATIAMRKAKLELVLKVRELLEGGMRPAQVARLLGVTHSSVSKWHKTTPEMCRRVEL